MGTVAQETAELHGRLNYTTKLLDHVATLIESGKLTPEHASRLHPPVLVWGKFAPVAFQLFDAINAATQHQLEGWTELGFETIEYHLEGLPPIPQAKVASLDDARRAAIEAMVQWRAAVVPVAVL